jgi:F-box-like
VSSLPEELLSMIFHLSISKDPTQYKSLAALSWVSARWRGVALNDASLWSSIDPSVPPEWQAMFLERSKNAPLSVEMTSYNAKAPHVESLLAQTSRIRAMTFDGNSTTINGLIDALASPAPYLEILTVNVLNSWPFDTLDRGVILSRDPHDVQAPLLRRVEFTNCTLPWNSSVFRVITSIKIVFEQCPPPFTPGELYEGLKVAAPHLQELDLHFDIDLKSNNARYPPIAFPALRKLVLSNDAENSLDVLHFLHLPTSTYMDLTCDSLTVADLQALCSDLTLAWVSSPLSRHSPPPPLQRLSIAHCHSYGSELKIHGWGRYADGSANSKGRILSISSDAAIDVNDFNIVTTINTILRSLPLRNLAALELVGPWSIASNMQQVLFQTPSVREIKFAGYPSAIDTLSFILGEVNTQVAPEAASTAPVPPILPSLQVVTLEYMPCNEMAALIERLSSALAACRARGTHSVPNIILKGCGPVHEDVLNQLKGGTGVRNVIQIN